MIGFYLRHFLDSPSTLATLAVLVLLATVVSLLARRRRLLVFATGASLALVGGFTLAPANGWTTFTVVDEPLAAVVAMLHLHASDLAPWQSADGPANIVLFVPLGLTLALLLRRPITAAALGVLVSVAVECYQAATGTRVGAAADIAANGLGAAIGAGVAAVWLLASAGLRRTDSERTGVLSRPVG